MLIAEGHNIRNFPSMPQVIVNTYLENYSELHVNLEDMGKISRTLRLRNVNILTLFCFF